MKKTAVVFSLFSLVLLFSSSVFAQSADELKEIRKEIEALKQGQGAIQKDLQEIKTLLKARPAPPQPAEQPVNAVLNVEGAHFRGEKNAVLTMIEFSDYQ